MGLLPVTAGRIEYDMFDAARHRLSAATGPIDRSFPMNVLDVVILGHWRRVGVMGTVTAALKAQAIAALVAVGFSSTAHDPQPVGRPVSAYFIRTDAVARRPLDLAGRLLPLLTPEPQRICST